MSQQNLLTALAETFGLVKAPRRIEVYDNSHIQGSNAVGAMIVAGREGFRKNQYRKFNIRSESLTPGDDFGMMREVLTRRFKRLMAEAPRSAADAGSVTPPQEAAPTEAQAASRVQSLAYAPPRLERGSAFEESMPAAAAAALFSFEEEPDREDTSDSPWPDLVLIDGGQGQLTAARETLAALGVTGVPLVGIAKGPERDAGRETFFMAGRARRR